MRWVAALARRAGLDANPLRRASDRAEAWLRIGLVLVFLIASPLAAIGLGKLTNAASFSAARAQAASERQVNATLLDKVARAADDPLYGASGFVWARARWTAPDGQQRSGQVPAPVGSQAGRTLSIWVDSDGPAGLPADRGEPDRQPGHRRDRAHPGRPRRRAAHRAVAGQVGAGPQAAEGLGGRMVDRRAALDETHALSAAARAGPFDASCLGEHNSQSAQRIQDVARQRGYLCHV